MYSFDDKEVQSSFAAVFQMSLRPCDAAKEINLYFSKCLLSMFQGLGALTDILRLASCLGG